MEGILGAYEVLPEIHSYGVIVKPLIELLKKGNFACNDRAQTTFQTLKQAMMFALILALPNFNLLFIVESDASNEGIKVVLSQEGCPVAYFNKGLTPKHQVLSIYKKEMMATLTAIKKWNAYLTGRHFQIKTDHYSLKFLLD